MPIESRTRISSRRSVALEGFMPIERCTRISSQRNVALEGLLSVKTHRRAVTGNTRSREASETAGGPRSLGQRPSNPAHTLTWSR
jgi:hypothetical protein